MSRVLHCGSVIFDNEDDCHSDSAELLVRNNAEITETMRELDEVTENPRRDGMIYNPSQFDEHDSTNKKYTERPYLSLFMFGWRVTYVTRRTYDVMPTLVRKAVDRLFSAEKRD
jgi:hypothetical protein